MIIRCSEKNRKEVLDYVNQDQINNLFIIGDIEAYGFDHPEQTVFIDKGYHEIKTVYLVYRTNLVIGSLTGQVDNQFVDKLVDEYELTDINGRLDIIAQLKIEGFELEECQIATLSQMTQTVASQAQLLEADDLEAFAKGTQVVFGRELDVDQLKEDRQNGFDRFYGFKLEGELVSGARTTAQTPQAAMIIGVFTLEKHRQNGYAYQTVARLCLDFLGEGKQVCLFYNNPNAALMYRKLGFEDVGGYGMMRKI